MDLTKVKIGDRVKSYTKGWLTVSQLQENVFIVEKNKSECAFYYNGKYYEEDENPEIVAWLSISSDTEEHSKEKVDFKPTYSGEKSIRFWEKINGLPETERSEIYLSAVILQNTERRVLQT